MAMAEEKFHEYLEYCYDNLEIKQEALVKNYDLGDFDEYFYDQDDKTLKFKKDDEVKLEFYITFIGSWSKKSNTWMWTWGNESMTEDVREKSSKLRSLYDKIGYDAFNEVAFKCDEYTAHELVALSVEELGAEGMYISPTETLNLFMALMEKK